jgi:hypothetical protein
MSDINKDTGAKEGSAAGTNRGGQGQSPYEHSDSGSSGGSKTTGPGSPGTAGSTPASRPGAPRLPDDPA